MDDDHRDLARRLFVVASELLEDVHPTAAAGQRHDLSREGCAACDAERDPGPSPDDSDPP